MTPAPLPNDAAAAWAQHEFGAIPLGDRRRTARLVTLAAAAARHPAGTITQVCRTDAERQGAYGLLAHDALTDAALGEAHYAATARRAAGFEVVVVPLDDSSLRVTDTKKAKGTGVIGATKTPGRGFKVMNALAVTLAGTTLGVLDQRYWTRTAPVTKDRHQRPLAQKETRHWEAAAAAVTRRLAHHAPQTHAWFQKDAGADSAELLLRDLWSDRLMTVRAVYNRRVHPDLARVRSQLAAVPLAGAYTLQVAAGPKRTARVAHIEVRHREVELYLNQRLDRRNWAARVWVVWAREVGTTPGGEPPLDWMLYTTYPVEDLDDACLVLSAYSLRWRLEEFHFTWKSGTCHVQDTELRAADRILKWATLLAAVASRAMHLRDVSRAHPDAPASAWFDPWELQAIVALRQPKAWHPGTTPTVAQATQWVAEIGGYTGRSSGGPPGVVVIRRGLDEVVAVAKALRNLAQMEK
jgi:hypothetical protein